MLKILFLAFVCALVFFIYVKCVLRLELVKSPEVTLCSWQGYNKPSINNNNNCQCHAESDEKRLPVDKAMKTHGHSSKKAKEKRHKKKKKHKHKQARNLSPPRDINTRYVCPSANHSSTSVLIHLVKQHKILVTCWPTFVAFSMIISFWFRSFHSKWKMFPENTSFR